MTNDTLRLEYIPLATAELWDRNPKKHSVQDLWASILRYGFKDPPKFEPKLNGGNGGIVEGNGRIIVLRLMQQEKESVPRGILVNDKGEWLVPVLFGVDARSQSAAEEYGIDHNSLVLAGGDLDGFDMARLWDASYVKLLGELDELPVTVDADMLTVLAGLDSLGAEDWSDLDKELEELDGCEEVNVQITVPAMHKDEIIKWLANGETQTAPGMGKGVMRRCGLL